MNTWQIWNILRYPLRRNVMFYWAWQDYLTKARLKPQSATGWQILLRSLSLITGIGIALAITPVALVVTLLVLIVLPMLVLLFNGTLLGLFWTSTITSTLADYLHGRADVLGATPRGKLGFSWIIATGCIHRGELMRDAYRLVRWVMVTVVGGLIIVMFFIGLNLAESAARVNQIILLLDVLGIMVFAIGAWIDHVQSIVMAMLITILAPTFTTDRPLIRIAASGAFLTLQIFFYALILALFRLIQHYTAFAFHGVIAQRVAVLTFCLLAFYGVREIMITILKRIMLQRYEATTNEFQAVVS